MLGWTRGRCHAVALVMRCYQVESYSGRVVVAIDVQVPVCAECRSIVPQIFLTDENEYDTVCASGGDPLIRMWRCAQRIVICM